MKNGGSFHGYVKLPEGMLHYASTGRKRPRFLVLRAARECDSVDSKSSDSKS